MEDRIYIHYCLFFQCIYYFTPFPTPFLTFYQSFAPTSQTYLLFSFLQQQNQKKKEKKLVI